jgi:aspartyl protease family protein
MRCFVAAALLLGAGVAQAANFIVLDKSVDAEDCARKKGCLASVAQSPGKIQSPYEPKGGNQYVIPKSADGHFWVHGLVNGYPVVFLVDTGASSSGIDMRVARNAQIRGGKVVKFDTNGGVVEGYQSYGNTIEVGPFKVESMEVFFGNSVGSAVLGMNFLQAFNVSFNKDYMLISAK